MKVVKLHQIITFTNRKPNFEYKGVIYVNIAQITHFHAGSGFDHEGFKEKCNRADLKGVNGNATTLIYFGEESPALEVAENPTYIKELLEKI